MLKRISHTRFDRTNCKVSPSPFAGLRSHQYLQCVVNAIVATPSRHVMILSLRQEPRIAGPVVLIILAPITRVHGDCFPQVSPAVSAVDVIHAEDALVDVSHRLVHIGIGGCCSSSSAGRGAVAPEGPVGGHVACRLLGVFFY